LGPIPNPQSPIPNPQSPLLSISYIKLIKLLNQFIFNYKTFVGERVKSQ
jgi:hypothetical protein